MSETCSPGPLIFSLYKNNISVLSYGFSSQWEADDTHLFLSFNHHIQLDICITDLKPLKTGHVFLQGKGIHRSPSLSPYYHHSKATSPGYVKISKRPRKKMHRPHSDKLPTACWRAALLSYLFFCCSTGHSLLSWSYGGRMQLLQIVFGQKRYEWSLKI